MRRAALALLLVALTAAGCGGDDDPVIEDAGPVHVHGLGINPRDGALFLATHTGLFRAPEGEERAERVGDSRQDTMGFTVVGPDHFLGSGHPDARDGLPAFLGLVESRDAGRTWKPLSLLGQADFHVLEAAGPRVYGFGSDFETRAERFLVSSDGGHTWDSRELPESIASLAIHPDDADRIVVSGASGIYESRDGGRGWRRLAPARGAGFLAWRSARELVVLDAASGTLHTSPDGRRWRPVGQAGTRPAAFEAVDGDLYAALHDGTIRLSTDGGRTWRIRSEP